MTNDVQRRTIGQTLGRAAAATAAVAWLAACAAGAAPSTAQPAPESPATDEPAVVEPGEFDSPLGGYLAGRLAQHERDNEAAARYFSRALVEDPSNFDLLRQTFLAMHAQGRIAEAVVLGRRLVDLKPNDSVAALVLAAESIRTGDYDDARARLGSLPKQGYNILLGPLLSAWAAMGQGHFDAAREALSELRDNDAFAPFRAFHDALISDLAGSEEAAERAYEDTIAQQQGGSYRVVAAFGAFHERGGRPDDAIALYEEYKTAHPDSDWFDAAIARAEAGARPDRLVRNAREGAAEVLFGVASALYQENAFEAALLYVRQAAHLRPGFDAGNMLLGEIYETLEQSAAAIEAYREIPRSSPLSWTIRLKIANALDDLERTDEAIAELRKLAAERADRPDALVVLGDLLRAKQRWHESIVAYDEALARIDTPDQRHWRPFYARGIALERSRQWQRAEEDFLAALELQPDQPFVLNYLGYSWVDQGINLDRALEMIQRAVDLRANDGYIIDSLGWAYYRMGNFEDAVVHLERASELRPEDPTINDHLGDAYWHVGRRLEARFQWQRALTLEPEEEEMVTTIKDKLEHGLLPSPVADGAS